MYFKFDIKSVLVIIKLVHFFNFQLHFCSGLTIDQLQRQNVIYYIIKTTNNKKDDL